MKEKRLINYLGGDYGAYSALLVMLTTLIAHTAFADNNRLPDSSDTRTGFVNKIVDTFHGLSSSTQEKSMNIIRLQDIAPIQDVASNSAVLRNPNAVIAQVDSLPTITVHATKSVQSSTAQPDEQALDLIHAIHIAVARHPSIAQTMALLVQQQYSVDAAKAGYWPQVQAGVSTGRIGTSEAGRQLFTVSASQVLYDFGKVKNMVASAEAMENRQKAQVLKQVDSIAFQTANVMVNISRFQALENIAKVQVSGVARILEIARLRANAGISSQADPIQAQTRYESAQANLLDVQSSLAEWRERLRTLVGSPLPYRVADIPDALFSQARVYEDLDLHQLPDVIMAESERLSALAQLNAAKAKRMPSLSLDASVSRALNGRNPNNNQDDGTYSSLMFSLSGVLSQGGALIASQRAAGYAEQAAKSAIDSAYLNANDQANAYREQIRGAQSRLKILGERERSIIKTKALYQEQYKLGTRSVLDLLNSEQEIYQAATDRENTRYDIWNNVVNYINVTGRAREAYALNDMNIQGIEIQP